MSSNDSTSQPLHRSLSVSSSSSFQSHQSHQSQDRGYCYPSAIIESLQTGSARSSQTAYPGTPSDIGQSRPSQPGAFPGVLQPTTPSTQRNPTAPRKSRDYNMSSYPITMGQEPYIPSQMAQNTSFWPSRSSRPMHSPPTTQDQPLPHPELFSPGYMGYSHSPQGYYQGRQSHYLPPQNHLRSPSIPYTSSFTSSPPLSDAPFCPSSPPYLLNQQDYYYPDSSLPASMPVSPQPQPQAHAQAGIYASPDSAPPAPPSSASDLDVERERERRQQQQQQRQREVRVVSSRPRPQCWDHGCNGREFSTFSNLLRHQREKSGAVAKAECPVCKAVFTRSTARNIHVAQGKCKSGS